MCAWGVHWLSQSRFFMEMQLQIRNYSKTEHQLYENKFHNADSVQLVRHWRKMRADGRTDYYRDVWMSTRHRVETKHPDITARSDPECTALREKKIYLIKKTDLVDTALIQATRNAKIFSKKLTDESDLGNTETGGSNWNVVRRAENRL